MLSEGIARILEAVRQAWDMLKPYAAVYPWARGVLLRRGLYVRTLEPGYYFKYPVLDRVQVISTVTTTMRGNTQTIGSRTVKWTVKYRVKDPASFVTDIYDEAGYLRDSVSAHVADFIVDERSEKTNAWDNMIRRLRDEVKEGGFEIIKLRLIDDTNVTFTHRQFEDVGEIDE